MKKSIKNLIALTTLGICIFSFIPAVAASRGRVTERPLDDWLDPNYAFYPWGEENWVMADWGSSYNNLVCKMGYPMPKAGIGPWVNDMVYENSLVMGNTIIDGYITERELINGQALITLHIDVKNAPLTVYDRSEFLSYCFGDTMNEPQAVLGAGIDGYIDFKLIYKFLIPEPGAELPTIWPSFDNYISINIIGTGFGTLTEHAVELGFAENAGATGMLRLHQISLFKPDFKEGHPKYDPYYGDFYPVETVEIHQMS